MKNNIIVRTESLLIREAGLEHLHTFKKVPASMACTTQQPEKDLVMDQVWDICKQTGLIQLRKLFSLDLVYKFPHNDGVGKVWENHDLVFAEFIDNLNVKSVFEIGSGSGRLGKLFVSKDSDYYWTALEPNHEYDEIENNNFIHIREWFDENYRLNGNYDAIVHSHVLEHSYDPRKFFVTIHEKISDDSLHIFSVPNLFHFIQKKYTNGLNFEHTVFLTEEIIDTMLVNVGFKIITKYYHKELPCIFYACKKTDPKQVTYNHSIFEKNKEVFLNFVSFYRKEIKALNNKINSFDGQIFLFGAHIFSQFLLYNGLNINRIKCVLDNSKMKQNKRLYGTKYFVKSPKILKQKTNTAVILKAGQYNTEIKNDILENINANTIFWE
jgi:2-polyprenyl-3-methyl-5-hydroxy-6-metoxy-1,4-benzoquinol methylase